MTLRNAVAALRYAGRMAASRIKGEPALTLASIYPTHRCNLRCVYCNSPFLRTPELTTRQWLGIIDQLAGLGCRRITILGGEPLLRDDVPEMIDLAHALGLFSVLTSNGLLVRRQIDRLRRLDTLVLSLDAAGPANDAVRGNGVFDAVCDAIRAAADIRLAVKINAVLSMRTAPLVNELIGFVHRHDLHVTVNIMRSGAPDLWRDAASIKAQDSEIQSTLERLADLAGTDRRLLFSPVTYRYAARWGDYSRDRFETGELPPDDPRVRNGPKCHAGRYYLTINPDGTVYPCALTAGRISGGNVVADGVETSWRRLHDHHCVACYSPCLVEQNYLFSLHPRVVGRFVVGHLSRFS